MAGYQPWSEQIPGLGTPAALDQSAFVGPLPGQIGNFPAPPQVSVPPSPMPNVASMSQTPSPVAPPPQPMGPRPLNIPTPNLQAPAIPGMTPIHPQSGLTKRGALLTDLSQGLQQFQGAMQRGDAQHQAQLYARGDAVLQMLQAAGQNPDPVAARTAQEAILAQPGAVEALRARGVALPGGESQEHGILSKIMRGVSGTPDRSGQSAPLPPGSMNQIPQVSPAAIQAQQTQAQQGVNQAAVTNAQGALLSNPENATAVAAGQLGLAETPAAKAKREADNDAKAEKTDKAIHSYVNADGKAVTVFQKPDNTLYEKTFGDVNQKDIADKVLTPQAQLSALYLKQSHGTATPQDVADIQALTKSLTAVPGTVQTIRMQGMGQTREYPVIDTQNNNRVVYANANDINNATPGRYVPAGEGAKGLNKEALLEDIRGNITQTRQSIAGLKNGFDPASRAQLAVSLASPTGTVTSFLQSIPRGSLTPDQVDYVTNLFQLRENAMAMRSVLGAGQGSEDLRAAIQATIPGAGTPNAAFANAQLDKFEKTIDRLSRGVPTVPLKSEGSSTPPTQTQKAFSVSAWKAKNPGGNVDAAVAEATRQGYKVNP